MSDESRAAFEKTMHDLIKSDACHCHTDAPEPDDLVLIVVGVRRDKVELLHAICDRPLAEEPPAMWSEFVSVNKSTMDELHPL